MFKDLPSQHKDPHASGADALCVRVHRQHLPRRPQLVAPLPCSSAALTRRPVSLVVLWCVWEHPRRRPECLQMFFLTFLGFRYFCAELTSQSEETSLGDWMMVQSQQRWGTLLHMWKYFFLLIFLVNIVTVIIYMFYRLHTIIGMCVPLIRIFTLHINLSG